MNSPLHLKIHVKSAGHRTVSGWSLTTPYGARPGIGRCYHIRRRPAPVRYVTTQEKILKNCLVPGRLLNSPVMCKSVKSYDVSFICDRSIRRIKVDLVFVVFTKIKWPHISVWVYWLNKWLWHLLIIEYFNDTIKRYKLYEVFMFFFIL